MGNSRHKAGLRGGRREGWGGHELDGKSAIRHSGDGQPVPIPRPETMWQLCKTFLTFLREEKKWWLVPLVVIVLAAAALLVVTGSSVLAPMMYPVR